MTDATSQVEEERVDKQEQVFTLPVDSVSTDFVQKFENVNSTAFFLLAGFAEGNIQM